MSIADGLDRRRFVVTTEVQVPSESTPEDLLASLRMVRGHVDAVSPTFGEPAADRPVEAVVADSVRVCEVLRSNYVDPIFRVATRGSSRPEVQERLLGAAERGVRELVAFTDDYRLTGDSLQEMMFFHVDAGKLFSVLECLREGRSIVGAPVPSPVDFCLGSGVDAAWGDRVPSFQQQEMEHMAERGVRYFVTTPVFDLDRFAGFMARVGPVGVPVIAEVMILRSAGMGHHLNRYVRPGLVPAHLIERLASSKDRERTSMDIFAELVHGLRGLCRGVHVVPCGAEQSLHRYLDAARIR
ncbi:MAG: methylenetetrahydrofolate reductase [Myxococcota bacterium]|nr:methylenetetrahydrofolate reductase [Myxococcota bacterium]